MLPKKPNKCQCCANGYKAYEDVIQIHANGFSGTGYLYTHIDCIMPTKYGEETRENINGTDNVTWEKTPRTSAEIEIFNDVIHYAGSQKERQLKAMDVLLSGNYPELTDLYIRLSLFGCKHHDSLLQQVGLDSSTALEGHISELSIEGSSSLFRHLTPEQVRLLNNENNGHHIHVDTRWDADRTTKEIAFGIVLDKIKEMTKGDRIRAFGSDFRFFANAYVGEKHMYIDSNDNIHYGFADYGRNERNIYPCICFHTYTTELRLARFHDAEQYTKLMKVWRGVVKEFNANYGKMDAYKLGKTMARALNVNLSKYQKGR